MITLNSELTTLAQLGKTLKALAEVNVTLQYRGKK